MSFHYRTLENDLTQTPPTLETLENTMEQISSLPVAIKPPRNRWLNSSYGKWLSYDFNLNFKSHGQPLPSIPLSRSLHVTNNHSKSAPSSPKNFSAIHRKLSSYEFLSYPVCILDDTGSIVYANRCFRRTISQTTTRFFDLIDKVKIPLFIK